MPASAQQIPQIGMEGRPYPELLELCNELPLVSHRVGLMAQAVVNTSNSLIQLLLIFEIQVRPAAVKVGLFGALGLAGLIVWLQFFHLQHAWGFSV